MTYAYYREAKKGKAPKNAPTHFKFLGGDRTKVESKK